VSALPPIDAHAHVLTSISASDLRELRSCVFAVTREPSEWPAAIGRSDELCVWGLGAHPGVAAAIDNFNADELSVAVRETPLIGEVGLDGASRVPMAQQTRVFREALAVAKDSSRLVTIHSVRAASPVLDGLEAGGWTKGVILHWWRGTETARAVEMGCYFSLNGAEAARPKVIDRLPVDRVLTETDFPHSRRADRAADRPGQVSTIEGALGRAWAYEPDEVRRQLWKNLTAICKATKTSGLMPRRIQGSLLAVR
jgi:TatD DNase family protein